MAVKPHRRPQRFLAQLAWFVGLWLLGVGAVTIVGLLIKAVL